MSVLLPRVISYAVLRTMPSVGMSSVGATLNFAVAASSLIAGLRLQKSTARFWVAKRLTTSSTGAFSAALHSDITMAAPYLPSLTMRSEPLPDQLLPMTFW